eukprot:gnl/MRDRNA2_/MRDRNA2_102505_c0_seq1.p1 gnl/MRDRNA2_/MRDRNA2_102505_c0~~gnl/MRDRNA2_/MRDRNA2_102505_c0_seq1.p1  ORF type:complete len:591 (+),score=104.54 gnl/MRDRNA2_/MRDRNA2_102505_c0_seq1:142-1914(+)
MLNNIHFIIFISCLGSACGKEWQAEDGFTPQYVTVLNRPPLPNLAPAGALDSTSSPPDHNFVQVSQGSLLKLLTVRAQMDVDQKYEALVSAAKSHGVPKIGVVQSTGQKGVQYTMLKNLDWTEYVGPIGVGTVKSCSSLASNTYNGQVNRSGDDIDPQSAGQACHSIEQQKLQVVFDTGSTNLWMASTLCTRGPCTEPGRSRYDPKQSSTYKEPNDPRNLDIKFGTAELSGPQGVDDFRIGPFVVKQQTFALIQQEQGTTFRDLPLEGIVGLAFPSMSAHGVRPFFDTVIKQSVLAKNSFAFYLTDQSVGGSSLSETRGGSNAILWGGIDKRLYNGELKWFPVTQAHYWAMDLLEFRVGEEKFEVTTGSLSQASTPMAENATRAKIGAPTGVDKAIIDTGTTYFTADGALYDKLTRKMPSAPCSQTTTYPDLTYKLKDTSGKTYELKFNQKDYMVSADGVQCTLGFMRIAIPAEYGPAMILGELFIRKYFTVFDRGDGGDNNAKIGFAPSNPDVDVAGLIAELPPAPVHPHAAPRSPVSLTSSTAPQKLMRKSTTVSSAGQVSSLHPGSTSAISRKSDQKKIQHDVPATA